MEKKFSVSILNIVIQRDLASVQFEFERNGFSKEFSEDAILASPDSTLDQIVADAAKSLSARLKDMAQQLDEKAWE